MKKSAKKVEELLFHLGSIDEFQPNFTLAFQSEWGKNSALCASRRVSFRKSDLNTLAEVGSGLGMRIKAVLVRNPIL